jgi:hypothetical protein
MDQPENIQQPIPEPKKLTEAEEAERMAFLKMIASFFIDEIITDYRHEV